MGDLRGSGEEREDKVIRQMQIMCETDYKYFISKKRMSYTMQRIQISTVQCEMYKDILVQYPFTMSRIVFSRIFW